MKNLTIVIAAGLVSACLPTATPNQIVVDGEASLEFEPDTFSLRASIRSRRENQEAALADIAERLGSIRETMPNLEGLTHLTINASSAEIAPIQDPECLESRRYNSEDACPVIAHLGSITLNLKGSPAKSSGRALSLLSELGAESVALTGYSLADMEAARNEALNAAVKMARENAESIAGAAGSTLIGPIRIQHGEGFGDRSVGAYYEQGADQIVVTASRQVVPETDLNLDPQPIAIRAKVVAAFEID